LAKYYALFFDFFLIFRFIFLVCTFSKKHIPFKAADPKKNYIIFKTNILL
jgi:hypothetical protein